MADAYVYPLLVLLEENNIPGLKIKLLNYFQSRKSNGGDCEVEYENGSKTAMLCFRREEDQKSVLSMKVHQISLDKGVLKMTVQLPSEVKTTQEVYSHKGSKYLNVLVTNKQSATDKHKPTDAIQAEAKCKEEPCSTSAVLENVPESMNKEFLEMLVENILKNLGSPTASKYSLEVIPDISCAVVTFQNGKDNIDFIARWPQNKMFRKITIRPLEVTEQVVVEGLSNCNTDVLQLYFENEGGDVEDVNVNEAEQSAVVTFKNHQAVSKVMKTKHQIKKEEVKVYPFYKSLGVALYVKDKPSPKLPSAIFEPIDNTVLKHLTSNKAAQDHLKQLLISKDINVEDSEVLKKPEWLQLVSQLENANSKSSSRIQIHSTRQQVVVSGHKDDVVKVSRELGDFLTANAHIEEIVAVKANVIIEYLKSKTHWLKLLEGDVVVSYAKEAIILSGPRAAVKSSKSIVEDVVDSVFFDCLKVTKPGVKKFFKDKESMYITSIKNETGCLVKLVDDVGEEQDDFAFVQVQKPVYQIQTADGVEIAVSKADMCSYPVDAVVNSSHEDLRMIGSLAGALLRAAGPQILNECNKIINVKGKLKAGECVITGAGGQLCCKKVIHAVGPCFDQTIPQMVEVLLKKTVKGSLELAEDEGCISVALPAISRNQGFPLHLCLMTIVKAVKEYCDENYNSTLKRIHLVDNDDSVVVAMEAAVKKVFGNQGVSLPQQIPTPNAVKPPVKQVASDPSLFHVKTKEGLDIVLKKGTIEAAKTDVIVNTVFDDLVLNRGAVSKAILNVAGPRLQQLVTNQKTSGTHGEIIVTDSCKLKSKQVFHVVAPSWDKGQGAAEETLGGIFTDCLVMAENNRLGSISFPAIGTGNLGFPKDLVASLMLNTISDFSSQTQPKHLKKVVIILYPKDTQTIKEFTDKFMQTFPNSSQSTAGSFSKVISGSRMHETKMGNVTVQLVSGDITKETTDVIVNSSNESFSLKSGVSKAILEAAGGAVERECQNLGSQPNQGMIMTQPGNLKCKKILHLVGQTDPVKINTVVKEALQMCVRNSHTSVSFPAIGTGQGNVQAIQVADAMLDAVIDVLSQNTTSALTLIRIVIFQQPMLKDFCTSMQQREASDPKNKVGFWQSVGQRFRSLFSSDDSEQTQEEEEFSIEKVKVEPACFHLCGDSRAKVDAAIKKINDLISDKQNCIEITDNAILNFSSADHQQIADIQKKMGVSIRTEIKNGQASIIIEGLHENVLKANAEINMLRNVRDDQEMKKKVEFTSKIADWQYQPHGLQFQSFDSLTNYQLEQALEKDLPDLKVVVGGQIYTVTMPKGPATDSKGNILQIRRIDKLKDDVPECWDTMPPGTTCLPVTIQSGTSEYAEVLNLFKATCNRPITKIERIQNPALWKSLQIKKQELEVRNNHQNNEKRLFHGTSETIVPKINERGFNRSYAGMNAAYFGNGSYFAVNAAYSAQDTYSKPNQNGEKFMYLCRVLTGDFTLGQQNMIAPPSKGGSSVHMYDSVVDNVSTPSMYVIFHDTQAYPEYLITFT